MSDVSDIDYATEYDYIHLAHIVQTQNLPNLYETDDESDNEDAQSVDPELRELENEREELEDELRECMRVRDEREEACKVINDATAWVVEYDEIRNCCEKLEADNKELLRQVNSAVESKKAAENGAKSFSAGFEQSKSGKAKLDIQINALQTNASKAAAQYENDSNAWKLEKEQLEARIRTLETNTGNAAPEYSKDSATWRLEKQRLECAATKLETEAIAAVEKLDSERARWREAEQRLNAEKFEEKIARSKDEVAWGAEKLKLEQQFDSEKRTWRETEQRLNAERSDEKMARIRNEFTWEAAKLALEEKLSTAATELRTRKQTWAGTENMLSASQLAEEKSTWNTERLALEQDNKQLREKHSTLEQSSKRDIEFAKNSASGSEQGRRRAIANMNKMFELQPDDYKDETFEQDIASPPDGKIADAIVERTTNRMNALCDAADKFMEQRNELAARNNTLAIDRKNAKHTIHALTVEVQALTNTIQARKNTIQALKDTIQKLIVDAQSKLNERETEIAKLKSMLDRLKTAAAEVQRNYQQDTENWKRVATNSAARQKSYENTVSTQTESIALVRKFLSDNADKFQ